MKGSHPDANSCALKYLSYRSRSKKELLDRLKRKGFSDVQISLAIQSLESAGLINDQKLAEEILQYSKDRKPLGKKGIESLLAKRGIDKELIRTMLSAHSADMEEESARQFVEKKFKWMKNYPEDIVKRRLFGMLQRRGFPTDVIHKVVKSTLN